MVKANKDLYDRENQNFNASQTETKRGIQIIVLLTKQYSCKIKSCRYVVDILNIAK